MKKTFLFAAFAAFTLLVSSCGDAEAEAKRLADSATEATRIADSVAAATEATEATRLADSAAAATEATRIADSVAAAAKKPGKKAKVEAVVPTTTTPTNKIGRKKNGAN